MFPLLIAFLLLLYLFNRLLRPPPTKFIPPSEQSKPTALEKLISEAFEYTPLSPDAPRILILYATEYGFAKEVANKLAASLVTAGFAPRLVSTLHYRLIDLTKESFLALVCSTTGDGAPPNEAADLRDALVAKDVVLPSNCQFAVLALGDRAYPHFCRAGVDFDRMFGEGRLMDRVDVDQEDWLVIDDFISRFETAVKEKLPSVSEIKGEGNEEPEKDYLHAAMEKYADALENRLDARYTRNDPFMATVVDQTSLTAPRTGLFDDKEVMRVEFDITDSAISYEIGDAVGIVPKNNSEHVDRLLRAMAANGNELVWPSDKASPVFFDLALNEQLDIKIPKPELVVKLGNQCTDSTELDLATRILGYNPKEEEHAAAKVSEWGKTYLADREVFDVVSDFVSGALSAQDLVDVLRPLHARYYSISSSLVVNPDRIAITVDVLRYSTVCIEREGVASTYLKDRCRLKETKVGLFISKNANFRLPTAHSRPIIMIGPGTGIAPFVGFIEERVAKKASGENWLFFGCRHEKQDFLYGERLRGYADTGEIVLHTAFSRDTEEKVYVQHRMAEHADELWRLIEDEVAHVYVCGDGSRMADDVDAALRKIVQEQGGRSEEEAKQFMTDLAAGKRYQRDVWVS